MSLYLKLRSICEKRRDSYQALFNKEFSLNSSHFNGKAIGVVGANALQWKMMKKHWKRRWQTRLQQSIVFLMKCTWDCRVPWPLAGTRYQYCPTTSTFSRCAMKLLGINKYGEDRSENFRSLNIFNSELKVLVSLSKPIAGCTDLLHYSRTDTYFNGYDYPI